jgi:hypothetical protein
MQSPTETAARKAHTYRAVRRNKARKMYRVPVAKRAQEFADIVAARTVSQMMDAFGLRYAPSRKG